MKRRICSVFLALAMMVSLMAFPVSAEESESAYDWSGESTAISEESGVITITGDGTLTLTADLTATVYVTGGTVTIDLGGYTLTQGSTTTNAAPYTSTIYVALGAVVTITGSGTVQNTYADTNKDGSACVFNNGTCTIESGTYKTVSSAGKAWYTIVNHGTMTINGGSFSNEASSSNSALVENGYASYSSGNAISGYVNGTNASASTLTINGGTFTSTGSACIKNDDNGTLVINDGTFSGSVTAITNWNIATINGGTFTVTSGESVIANSMSSGSTINQGILTINGGTYGDGTGSILRSVSTASTAGTTTINGGIFYGTLISASYTSLITSDNVLIYGGTFTDDVSDYHIKYTWSGSDDDISESDGIITISGDGTLTLIYDTTATVYVTSGTVTIDLGGYTLTQGSTTTSAAPYTSTIYVAIDAVVTITGDGTVKNTYADTYKNGSACVFNNGTCTIENGTYQTVSSTNYAWYTIVNHGTMTINDGIFSNEASVSNSSLVENGYSSYTNTSELNGYVSGVNQNAPSMTINGGTFTSTGSACIKNDDNGTLVINDGDIAVTASGSVTAITNWNIATINGGTFTVTSGQSVIANSMSSGSTINQGILIINGGTYGDGTGSILRSVSTTSTAGTTTINGGTFNGTLISASYTSLITSDNLLIYHGTFTDNAVSNYLASSYTVTDEDGNTITASVILIDDEVHAVYAASTVDPTCTEAGYTIYACVLCDEYTCTADETEATGHSYEAVVTEPTCTEGGYTTYTCTVCGDTYTADETEATGHSYEAVVTEPTCTEGGYTTYTCTVCGDTYTADETEALGHIYDPVGKTPNGYTIFACEICGDTYESDEIVPHVHSFDGVVTEPTCTKGGYTTYTCSICGKSYVSDWTQALGHHYDKGRVTKPATETAEGIMTYTCTVCGETYTETIPMIEAETESEDETETCPLDETCPIYPYTDTDMTSWYHDAVHYVIENGIMIGTGDTTWEPDTAITRAMIVTILYRLEGSPDVEGTSAFDDVVSGSWYEAAVIWAEQNGIAEGYGDGTYGPNDTLTREQFAAIMYRYSAYKGYDVSASADLSVYPDADEVSTWAESAMSWAVGSGLITGTLESGVTYLAPTSETTRAQGAQIIYRYILALAG